MQHTSTHITKLCTYTTSIGIDANISPILGYILDNWKLTPAGEWAEDHAYKIYWEIAECCEEQGALIKIMVDFNHDDAVAYKLMFGTK
jgi:predicted RecB family nuclease